MGDRERKEKEQGTELRKRKLFPSAAGERKGPEGSGECSTSGRTASRKLPARE